MVGGVPEIYTGGSTLKYGLNDYWYALRRTTAGDYEMSYVSPMSQSGIAWIALGDVCGDSQLEIVVLEADGTVTVLDQISKSNILSFDSLVVGARGLALADLDGDAKSEILVSGTSSLKTFNGAGVLLATIQGVGGTRLAAGQMDADPSMEIALSDGSIVDYDSRSVQVKFNFAYPAIPAVADIDGDGYDEVIFAEKWTWIHAVDVDLGQEKWKLPAFNTQSIAIADANGDGSKELLLGDAQFGGVHAFSLQTLAPLWNVLTPDDGVMSMDVGDVYGNGTTRLVFASGASSSGPDHIHIADVQTQSLEWQTPHLDGPFASPAIGDIDGDGMAELVTASNYSNTGFESSRFVIFDALTLHTKAIASTAAPELRIVNSLRLRDVDGNGDDEIVVAGNYFDQGSVEIWDFHAPHTFTRVFSNQSHPLFGMFDAADVADLDGNGSLEVVASTRSLSSNVWVYEFLSGAVSWQSPPNEMLDNPTDVQLVDANGSGGPEIIALCSDGDLRIYDGATKDLEARLNGPFAAMNIRPRPGLAPEIWVGDATGKVRSFRWDGATYAPLGSAISVSTSNIKGFEFARFGSLFVGAADTLHFQSKPGLGFELWSQGGYGTGFGTHVVENPLIQAIFTPSNYALIGLRRSY